MLDPDTFNARAAACAGCAYRARGCRGPCPCNVDGVDSILHMREGYCPLGKYRGGLGDFAALFLYRSGIRALVMLASSSDGETCGCKQRQKMMNFRFAALAKWLWEWRVALRELSSMATSPLVGTRRQRQRTLQRSSHAAPKPTAVRRLRHRLPERAAAR